MRIAAVDVELISLPAVTPPFAWRRGLRGSAQARTTAVLRITTEEGAVGEAYHEWSGPMLADIVDRVLRRGARRASAPTGANGCGTGSGSSTGPRSSRSGSSASSTSHSGTSRAACWAFRCIACSGRTASRSPPTRRRSTFATVEEYLDVADQCLELGFSAIKLHAWGDARADADLCQRLRAHVGPDVDLMYDGSAGFDLPERGLPRPTRSRRPATAGTRSRCASSA